MFYYSNASQLYFDFVYDQYLNVHSESKYLLDLINVIDWSVVPNFIHKRGRLGYSNQSILKALFVQMVMKLLESQDFYIISFCINAMHSTWLERTVLMSFEPSVLGNKSTAFFHSRYWGTYRLESFYFKPLSIAS
jgi:hypothetical protein